MKKEVISGRQGISLIFLILSSGGIVNFATLEDINQDIWISAVISAILAIPYLLIFYRLTKLYPNQNLFEILETVFGKIGSKIISVLFIWYGLHLGALVINHSSGFMKIATIPETKTLLIVLLITVVSIIALKCGIEVIARCAQIFFWILLVFMMIVFLLSLGQLHLDNLMPVLFDGWEPVIKGSIAIFSITFGQIILFSVVINQTKSSYSTKKMLLTGGGIFMVSFLLIIIRYITVLGMNNVEILLFPSFAVAGLINIGGFLRSVEIFIALYYLINTLFLIIISMYFTLKGMQKLFNINNSGKLAAPVGFITLALFLVLFKDSGEMYAFYRIIPYYFLMFQLILRLSSMYFRKLNFGKYIEPKGDLGCIYRDHREV